MLSEPTVNERTGHVSYGKDENSFVRFYKYLDKGKLKDFIEIIAPGDTRSEMRREVQELDKKRWPNAYHEYITGEASKEGGYPLNQWAEMDEALIRLYNYQRIYTVEQLAEVADVNLDNLGPGARALRTKAITFVGIMQKTKEPMELAGKLDAANERIVQQEKQIADQKSRIDVLEAMFTKLQTANEKPAGVPETGAEIQTEGPSPTETIPSGHRAPENKNKNK